MMPSPWPDQLSGGRRITTRHFETAEMVQGGENSRLHHTGVYPEGGCCAARIRPSAWTGARVGEGRGRPRRIGDAIWSTTPKPSEIGANPARRRSIMGEEAPSCESRFPLELVGRYRPVATVSASAHVFGSDGGSTYAADEVGRRLVPQAQAGLGHGPSQNGTTTRDHGALCAGLNRRIGHVSTSPVSRHKKSAGVRTKTSKWRREFGEVGGAINLLKPAIFTLADGTHAARLFQRCCRRETDVLV